MIYRINIFSLEASKQL